MLVLTPSRQRWHIPSPLLLPLLHARSLRTGPRVIPSYLKRWNPTIASIIRSPAPLPASLDSRSIPHQPAIPSQSAMPSKPQPGPSASEKPLSKHQLDPLEINHLADLKKTTARFESKLRRIASGIASERICTPLWFRYLAVRSKHPEFLRNMPADAWDTFWTVLHRDLDAGVMSLCPRRNRLRQLERDMLRFGKTLSSAPRARQLLHFYVRGEEQRAVKEWEDDNRQYLASACAAIPPDHLEIGARLLALTGNLDRSVQIMNQLYTLHPDWDASLIMIVFRAHTDSQEKQHHETAKDLYLRMKEQKADLVKLEDYHSCLVGFLQARHLPYAKRVFRDMVHDGHLLTTGTTGVVDEALKKLHMLYRLGTDIASMTSIALDALLILPAAYHGRIFGDWMKAAVIHKAPEVAGHILEMMYHRGTKPDTFHYNMLLRALLRTKESPNILKAENVGWQMIEEARKSYQRKLKARPIAEMINQEANDTTKCEKDIVRKAPIADVSTFALIMHHHAKVAQWEHVDYLARQLEAAAIVPNATIMNVLIDNKCRQGAYSDAWNIYQILTQPPEGAEGVFPNGASFRHLWKMLRLALGDHATRRSPGIPSPRELLKETVDWWTKIHYRYDAPRALQGLAASDKGAIIALMMHCFSYARDPVGSLVALHVLRRHFHIFPNSGAAEILRRQMSWVDMSCETSAVRSQYFYSPSNKRNSDIIAKLYKELRKRRIIGMGLSEGGVQSLTGEQLGDFELALLSEFVRVVLKRAHSPETIEKMIILAKAAVGMPNMPTGDLSAFEVV